MRMRKLGKGQSVMFCGSVDIERKILECCGKPRGAEIEVVDVLRWSISETFINTKKCVPLWAVQGMRHLRRLSADSKFSGKDDIGTAVETVKSLLEPESQSLQDRYGLGGRRHEERILLDNMEETSISENNLQLQAMRAKCRDFELSSFNDATLREEQEREIFPESEQERQIELAPALKPHRHRFHLDVKLFICEGVITQNSDAFEPAFENLTHTSAIGCLEMNPWSSQLLATIDFVRTVQLPKDQVADLFLRPVHWVASRTKGTTVDMVLLSPHEAHESLPFIRQHKAVTLHVYSPRVNMGMITLEDLSFCATTPALEPWPQYFLTMQLNIFAGQLYLKTYEDYLSLCRFLGLCFRPPEGQIQVAYDGFIAPADRPQFDAIMARECRFTRSAVEFLRLLMTFRRKGQGIERSHMGRIINGELLTRRHFLE